MAESNDAFQMGAPMRVAGAASAEPPGKSIEQHAREVAQQIVGAYTVLLSEIISGLGDRDPEIAAAVGRRIAEARRQMDGPDGVAEVRFVFDALLEMLPIRDARFRPNQS